MQLGAGLETSACLVRIIQLEAGPAPEKFACKKGAQKRFLGGCGLKNNEMQ